MKSTKNLTKFTRARDTRIDKQLLRNPQSLYIHCGKTFHALVKNRNAFGLHLGEFAITKKLGKRIHNSERNRKKKNKQRK